MVAPRPLEPLVLYLAATPHSASAALVAVREEHPIKGSLGSTLAAPPVNGAPEVPTNPPDNETLEGGVPEATAAPTDDKAPEDPQP